MNVAHLHLLLNHVPTVGSAVALGLLLIAFFRRSEPLKHAGLEVLFLIAVLTLPVYISGVGAHRALREQPVSNDAIAVHQDAALVGFTAVEFTGFLAWVALWQLRRRGRSSPGLDASVTVLLIVSLALMARAANLGGEIRHPEIVTGIPDGTEPVVNAVQEPAGGQEPAAGQEPAGDPGRFLASAVSQVMVYSSWVWPAAEAVHFLGLSLSLGVLLAVNLRILGVMKHVAFADVHRLLPWGMLGFGANLITGMLFFVGQSGQYLNNVFFWKIVFLLIAGANFLYLTVFKKAWEVDGLQSSVADKAMAVSSIVAWLAVLYAGRMLPFLGNAF